MKMKFHTFLERHWQQPSVLGRILLSPLSRLFACLARQRRLSYQKHPEKIRRLPVPVVIVGNIHVGGTGKTPITGALVNALQQRGVRVGIISRGYGRSSQAVHILRPESSAAVAGDEPLLLYRQTHAPMAVGADRFVAGSALLQHFPDIQLMVADDGLQHYALHRDLEIAVFPAAHIGRTLDVLPNGCLREPLSRLQQVDAVVLSQSSLHDIDRAKAAWQSTLPVFSSRSTPSLPYCLRHPERTLAPGSLHPNASCAALAGIARPERFFRSLADLGFTLQHTVALPDHAPLSAQDLPAADYVFITEKDAVKLNAADVPDSVYVLPLQTHIEPDLAEWVCRAVFHHADSPA